MTTTAPDTIVTRSRRALGVAAERWWAPLRRGPGAVRHSVAGQRRHAIHARWRDAVAEIGLSERMYLSGRVHRVEPRITQVVLGRSERFTIRLGAGQTFDDVATHGKAIARAFEVPRIRLTELADDLLEIELLPSAASVPARPTAAMLRRPAVAA
ncbi:hypothetical protein EV188_105215 [Actinomycetospora succinea]|uniref:Uncharacterized protein n=1 Tax=Actinomycetospora succinea TaxID=663603 RepID=A0A4R6VFB9_9PSEU|nr:hypothetical protein [Actinomycetospora succinea]TDQ55817.1 hypothetical protein EV188_105215 [Actinomycetospora succinea]